MTTTTETIPATGAAGRRLPRLRTIVLAFVVGIILASISAAVGLAAYTQMQQGRVLPGVRVGTVDISGLDRAAAADRLHAAYGSYGQGHVLVTIGTTTHEIPYSEVDRRADVDAMLDAAFAVGRGGSAVDQALGTVRALTKGTDIQPRVSLDTSALSSQLAAIAESSDRPPVDAQIKVTSRGFAATPAVNGSSFDYQSSTSEIAARLGQLDAPAELKVTVTPTVLVPSITDAAAAQAASAAASMSKPIVLQDGKETWTIKSATIRGWIDFAVVGGVYAPQVDPTAVRASLKTLAKQVDRQPKDARFLFSNDNKVVGITASVSGRALDVPNTASRVLEVLTARATTGLSTSEAVTASLITKAPKLTTEVAQKSAPLMKPISSWTTYYQSGLHNGFGTNITLPSMTISGTVVAPGEWFSYLTTIGPITQARGYKLGGAIIDGHSVEGKTIGGGMCSSSTTLFNAALRGGYQIGARRNHYYYIARYPLGLDATVVETNDGGIAQDMSWRNDTPYPVLIRAYARPGIVRFTLYSVPNGRHVSLSRPTVKNFSRGYTVVQKTTSIPAGSRQQVEYQANGQDVWVTRVVRDSSGSIVHQETYYSHYTRMIGIVLLGVAKT